MSLAVLSSKALFGLQAKPVQVEVHVGNGLPSFSIVGLPGAGVRESRERVRSAIINSGYEFPAGRITANLAPADLPKDSGRFDLPIAIGVLLASGQLVDSSGAVPEVSQYVLVGELSLTGSLIPSDCALVIALAIIQTKPDAVLIMAKESASIAALVPGLNVLEASTLYEVAEHICCNILLNKAVAQGFTYHKSSEIVCMSEVRGQAAARHALELAAAGGHSLLMHGSPGVGKSMLAHRLPSLLPNLSEQDALESAAVYSLINENIKLSLEPPFRAPHHGASMPALVGGGIRPRPGEISLAHKGVLFLDELPEFERRALEALREPIETGHITIARASGSCRFPARFQLIAAMNPCPCGWLGHPQQACVCSIEKIQKYHSKISGPLLDRIDLHVKLSVEGSWLDAPLGESSAVIQARVIEARELQLKRQNCLNSDLEPSALTRFAQVDFQAQELLAKIVAKFSWSARATQRALRVARTLADLDKSHNIKKHHISQAAQFRANNI